MDTIVDFSIFLKEARSKSSLSQSDFAEKIGIPMATFKSYEMGKRAPSLNVAISICHNLGISISEAIGEVSPIEKPKKVIDLAQFLSTTAENSELINLISQLPQNNESKELIEDLKGMIEFEIKRNLDLSQEA